MKRLACPKRSAAGYDLYDSVFRVCCPHKLFLSAGGGAAGKLDNRCRALEFCPAKASPLQIQSPSEPKADGYRA